MGHLRPVDPKTADACIRFFGQFGPLWSAWRTIEGVKLPEPPVSLKALARECQRRNREMLKALARERAARNS